MIKSLAMVKRSLDKAFMYKSQFIIMIHSEWCLLFFTCLLCMGRAAEPFIFWEEEGGLAKEKQNHAQEKKERKWYTRKHGRTFMQVSPILGICITGMLERKFSYF